jgi:RNA polymerase sigma factor (sigma-70 family)
MQTVILMDNYKLVKQCMKGDRKAQLMLYEQFAEAMLAVCYRYTKSRQDAEDVLQEGFVKVFTRMHQFKFDGELAGWIRRIMVNTAINYLKKNSKYQSEMVFTDAVMHPVSTDEPEVRMNAKEIAALIRQLPTGYQTIFNLYAVEGYSHGEIAEMMGINEGTSRSQYSRARSLLITWMNKESNPEKMSNYVR